MKIRAVVTINNSNFDAWLKFYQSYAKDRLKYVKDETVKKMNEQQAEVSFEILDMEGLTELSASKKILEAEEALGVETKIIS
jgi:hypothetical protein